ncbi:MAG: RDD family protein [Bacteroidales bacterium]
MIREEQLKFCKICSNQKFDFNRGIVCRLTDAPADFEWTCPAFAMDETRKQEQDSKSVRYEIAEKSVSQGKRLANLLLGTVFIYVFSILVGVFLGIILAVFAPDGLSFITGDNTLLNYLFGFCIYMVYYSTLEFAFGRTIAKYITKTKVVDENGRKPSIGKILIRTLCRFIPFEAFSFLGSDNIGWHDEISKTRVIAA